MSAWWDSWDAIWFWSESFWAWAFWWSPWSGLWLINSWASKHTPINKVQRLILKVTSDDVLPHTINFISTLTKDKGINPLNINLTKV